jgi:hypothetical protein
MFKELYEEELVKDKPYYTVQDIMRLMDCSKSKAYDYIRVIKSVSDVGKTRGRVMKYDFDVWAYGCPQG